MGADPTESPGRTVELLRDGAAPKLGSDGATLLRLALDLGARECGGPLTLAESRLLDAALSTPLTPGEQLDRARAAIQAGGDPLGALFCAIRSARDRRTVGAFYTPPELVEPMIDWTLGQCPDRIVDAGCGSGRFAASVARRDPAIPLLAIDLDPVATLMTRAALAVLGARQATVRLADFTDASLPPIQGRTAYVGNPPYVRHHDLSLESKVRAVETAGRLGHRTRTFALSGLHAHFFVAIAAQAKAGDVGCLLTSQEWLDVGYGRVIRSLLLDGLGGRAVHVVAATAVPFGDAMTTAAIACFVVGESPRSIRLRRVASPIELHDLTHGRPVEREVLAKAGRWSPLLQIDGTIERQGRTVPLGAVARVHRGQVTGSNDFFVLTREEAQRHGIARWCRPAVTSGRELMTSAGVIRDGPDRRLVVDIPGDLDRTVYPEVDAFLAMGEQRGIPSGYVASRRRPWWSLGLPEPAPIIVSYMARQPPRFASNPDGLALINVGHGIYPRAALSSEQRDALVATLNLHREDFRGAGRTYHGGMEKFEPREVENLPLPIDALPAGLLLL